MTPSLATARQSAKDRVASIRGVFRLSDDEVKVQRRLTVLFVVGPLVGVVLAMIAAWGWGMSPLDLGLLLGLYFFTGLGITVGFHRHFTHKSFDAPRPVRWVLAVAGSMAVQGSVISWVADHRRHHAYSDDVGDPHSPHLSTKTGAAGVLEGLWHAHIGWFTKPERTERSVWAPDLLDNETIARVDRAFPLLVLVSFFAPALIGGLLTMSLWGAVTAFLWGSLVRIALLHHVTWSINSICHFYGTRPFKSHDESRNNPVMGLLAFGEGWHNAHHAFPASARHGLRWWEFDISWVVIRTLELTRLARNVKLPSANQLARKAAT